MGCGKGYSSFSRAAGNQCLAARFTKKAAAWERQGLRRAAGRAVERVWMFLPAAHDLHRSLFRTACAVKVC